MRLWVSLAIPGASTERQETRLEHDGEQWLRNVDELVWPIEPSDLRDAPEPSLGLHVLPDGDNLLNIPLNVIGGLSGVTVAGKHYPIIGLRVLSGWLVLPAEEMDAMRAVRSARLNSMAKVDVPADPAGGAL